ncbi:MAG: methyltransferase, TrmH family, group 3, partial [Bacteroidota bacterium]
MYSQTFNKTKNKNPRFVSPQTFIKIKKMKPFIKREKPVYDNLLYGRHPIIEAFDAGRTLDVIYTQKDLKSEILDEIRLKAKEHNVPIKAVPKEKLDYLTYRANHQGVAAFISEIKYAEKEEILEQVLAKGKTPLFLILDSITDVRNFGAIARTALGTGVQAIIIPKRNSAQVNSDAMKTSAGALNKLPVCREDDLVQTIKWCKAQGMQVLVSDLKATKKVSELDYTKPTVIVVGEEAEGVNRLIINRADETFIIPILPAMDSYNVSVATGIILYEAMK